MDHDSTPENTGVEPADVLAFLAGHGRPDPSQWFVLTEDEACGVFYWDDDFSFPMLLNFEFDDKMASATYLYLRHNGALLFKSLAEATAHYRGHDSTQQR